MKITFCKHLFFFHSLRLLRINSSSLFRLLPLKQDAPSLSSLRTSYKQQRLRCPKNEDVSCSEWSRRIVLNLESESISVLKHFADFYMCNKQQEIFHGRSQGKQGIIFALNWINTFQVFCLIGILNQGYEIRLGQFLLIFLSHLAWQFLVFTTWAGPFGNYHLKSRVKGNIRSFPLLYDFGFC